LARIERSIEIKASPEKVWEMLALDRFPEWAFKGELKSVEYTSEVRTPEDKYRVSASAHIIDKRGEHDVEITESIENEKMIYRSKPPYYTYTEKHFGEIDAHTKTTIVKCQKRESRRGDVQRHWKRIRLLFAGCLKPSISKT